MVQIFFSKFSKSQIWEQLKNGIQLGESTKSNLPRAFHHHLLHYSDIAPYEFKLPFDFRHISSFQFQQFPNFSIKENFSPHSRFCNSAYHITPFNFNSHSDDTETPLKTDTEESINQNQNQSIKNSLDPQNPTSKDPRQIKVNVSSQAVVSPRHDMVILFTCTVCETRSAKSFSRSTYETGVVIVRCSGCKNLHLIADRKGWFGNAGSIEDFAAEKGFEIRLGNEEVYEFGLDELQGWSPKKT